MSLGLIAILMSAATTPVPNGPVRFAPRLNLDKPNAHYVNQRAPLTPSPLQKLPVGAVRPAGWLKVQLDLQRKGFAGQLADISQFLDIKNNAWMGNGTAQRAGWEELPYWLKGQVSLAYTTGDPAIIAQCREWIEGILKSQGSDGWFGPESNRDTQLGTPDLWPNMLAQSVLQTYYEATGDQRVIDLMSRYCDYLLALPDKDFIDPRHYWHYHRVGDQIASLIWLYNRTGDAKTLHLAARFHRAGANWSAGVANHHGVNFAQAFREPASYGVVANEPLEWAATERDLKNFTDEFGQFPGGMYGADENARKGRTDPRQAAESCAVVEMMFSDALLFEYSADPQWGDRTEDVTYNWMPTTMTSDLKALRYLTGANMAVSDAAPKNPGIENGGPMFLMDPNDHRCCQHNVGMGWPYFTERLWFATNDNGLLAATLTPSEVTAKVGGGTEVTIRTETDYPFRDQVRLAVAPVRNVKFPLSIRIPAWARGAQISINGKAAGRGDGGQFAIINREWRKGDTVDIRLPMRMETRTWSEHPNSLSVYRGPLAYSLRIEERYKTLDRPNGWNAFEIWPESAWNYGLNADPKFTVKERPVKAGAQPWDLANVPIELETTGRLIPEWRLDMYGLAAPLQASPAFSDQPEQRVTLVPMGAARLRISVFPIVSNAPGAHRWTAPAMPRPSIPATYSHRFDGDTESALSDGLIPKSSGDQDIPRFTWWDRKGSEEWVQYNFPANRTFQNVRVYFFDDRGVGQCRTPQSWRIQVRTAGEWRDVEPIEPYTTVRDGWSTVTFRPVAGTQIRLLAQLAPDASGGILEWEVN